MTSIYRYIRPLKFNEQRLEMETVPYGGICLKFIKNGNFYWFTFSDCAAEELFSKATARQICQRRQDNCPPQIKQALTVIDGFSAEPLTHQVIKFCLSSRPASFSEYQLQALKDFGSKLEQLMLANELEQKKQELWKASINALHIEGVYAAADALRVK